MSFLVFAPPPDLNLTLDPDIYEDGSILRLPSTPGATGSGTLISYVVPVGKTLWVKGVHGSCKKAGFFTILNGATTIGSFRVGAGYPSHYFPFDDAEEVGAGVTFSVAFTQDSGTSSSVEAYAGTRLL